MAVTHGAVVTREYGLPAVVGVENANEWDGGVGCGVRRDLFMIKLEYGCIN